MAQEYREVVEFPSGDAMLRGVQRVPPEGVGTVPLVVMAHGMGGLKEWASIPTVSDAILTTGIATLAFDYRNFGDSGGLPREFVDNEGPRVTASRST